MIVLNTGVVDPIVLHLVRSAGHIEALANANADANAIANAMGEKVNKDEGQQLHGYDDLKRECPGFGSDDKVVTKTKAL